MQTSPLNIWGLKPAEVAQNTTGKPEEGFDEILNQTQPTSETTMAGILGETGLEAGSNGPIALDQELDQALESQTSSDLIALMMAGTTVPQKSDSAINGLPSFAVVELTSTAAATESDLLAKKAARTEQPVRVSPEVATDGIELPEGFEPAAVPTVFEGEVTQEAKPAQASQNNLQAAASVERALPDEAMPFMKTNDPIGQLLNEKWQAWVKQNYVGPLTPQNPAAMMPAAMNSAFSAAAQTGQITLAQTPAQASAAVTGAAAVVEGETVEGVAVEDAPQPANPNLGGVFSSAVRTALKASGQQNESAAQGNDEETASSETAEEATSTAEVSAEQTRVQGKDQSQAPSQPLSLQAEKAVAKQASVTLQDMIAAKIPKTMTIRLNPDDLGSLTIKVRQFGKNIEAEVSASLDSVRHALTNQKQELAAAVENRGAQLTSLVVKSESTTTDSLPNNSFGQNGNPGDGRTHQEAQQEANRFARLTASHSAITENNPARTQVRTGRTSRFDLTA